MSDNGGPANKFDHVLDTTGLTDEQILQALTNLYADGYNIFVPIGLKVYCGGYGD